MVWEMAAGPFSDLSPEPWLISKRGKPEFANNSTTDKRQRQKGTSWNESYHTPLHVGNILFQVVVVVVDTSCQAAGKGRKNPIYPQALSNNLYQSVVDAAAGTAAWVRWSEEIRKMTLLENKEERSRRRRGKRTNEKKAFHGPKVAWFPGYSFR